MANTFREDDEPLAIYLDRMSELVCWQLAKDGDTLPSFLILPRPTNGEHYKQACDILAEMVYWDFDGAKLPPIFFEDEHSADQ